jgi:nucleotide-binding universal stress UspA family protein
MTTLVVATDGSDLALQAAVRGLSLTRPAEEVLVVSAIDLVVPGEDATGHAGPTITPEVAESANSEARESGQAAITAVVEAITDIGYAPEQVTTRLIEGGPGPSLCRLAGDVQASAVIIGSRGRGGLKRALLGSVSDYVVRNAPCTVIVSRDTE